MSEIHGTYKGAASLTGRTQFKKVKQFYIEENQSNIYRLLPPFKGMAKTGGLLKYHQVFWMAGTNGKKRPVSSKLSIGKDKQVLVPCPIYSKVEILRKQLDLMKADPKANPQTVEMLGEKLWALNLDKSYYANVITPSGEIGVLKMKKTAKDALERRLQELEASGIDAINVGPTNGVYFDFKRFKVDGKVTYDVVIFEKTKVDATTGRKVKEVVEAPIDEVVLKRMENEAEDLLNMFTTYTDEQYALLATLDPKAIDRAFARPDAVQSGIDTDDLLEEEGETDVVEAVAETRTVTTTAKTVVKTETPVATATTAPITGNTSDNDLVKQFLMSGN